MSRFRYWVGMLLALIATGWFVWFSIKAIPSIDRRLWSDASTWVGVSLAGLAYAVIIPISAWAWSKLLRDAGESRSPVRLAILMGRTQLAKYLPGNIAQHGARFLLATQAGIRIPAYALTVIQETVLAVTASVVVGIAMLAADGRVSVALGGTPFDFGGHALLWGMVVASVVSALLLFRFCPTRQFLARWMPSVQTTCLAFLAYVVNYLLVGLGLYLLVLCLGFAGSISYAAATSAFALSWVAGFLAPGAPAGVGVREAAMVVLLSGTSAPEDVFAFVALARVSTMLGDALCFFASWCSGLVNGGR